MNLIEVTLDLAEEPIAGYEWIEEGKGYGEWLVPCALISPPMTLRLVDENELLQMMLRRADENELLMGDDEEPQE